MTTLIFVLLTLILVSLWAGFYAIVKQQGRILLRLDQLEKNPRAAASDSERPAEQDEPEGLPLTTDCPPFSFPDLAGNMVGLENFRGRQLLLVHWSFQCGFCESIAPELTRLHAALEKQKVQLALLAYGDAAANRKHAAEHGLKCPMLLQSDQGPAGPFNHEGTPVAYLLTEEGKVAKPVARGADRVLALAREMAGEEATASSTSAPRSELGTVFPAFQLPDLGGGTAALADFLGHRVLLLHWNFDCGFCSAIVPELARVGPKLEERNVRLVLLAKGEPQFNRERADQAGIKSRILLLQNGETPRPFAHRGTPVAYLLDEEGRIAAPFASGHDQVIALAREAAGVEAGASEVDVAQARPAEDSGSSPLGPAAPRHRVRLPGLLMRGEIGLGDVIKRVTSTFGIKACVGCERRAARLNRWLGFSGAIGDGLKAGTRAPHFRLPDLQGRIVSLKEYRGRRVLLVFSDPHCGPCDELAPHLVRFHQQHSNNGLALVLVGRGDADENRHKAEQFGFHFPVVIQPKWQLSKEYGILATPVAFLIGEDGVIAKDVAVGRDPIVALAQAGAGALTSGA